MAGQVLGERSYFASRKLRGKAYERLRCVNPRLASLIFQLNYLDGFIILLCIDIVVLYWYFIAIV